MKNHSIYKILNKLAKGIEGSDQLAVPFLAVKAKNHLKKDPQDKAVGALSIVLAEMVNNNKSFMTREAFRDLYHKHYVNGSNASEVFASELNYTDNRKSTTKLAEKRYEDHIDVKQKGILATALSDALNDDVIKHYSNDAGKLALSKVSNTLDIWGLNPSKLHITAGNSKYLVVQADYETPKGLTSVHIPIEVCGNSVKESFIFVGNNEPQDLNNVNLKNYIKASAGTKLSLTGDMLLSGLDIIAEKNSISNAEMALIKLNAKRKSHTAFASNCITGLKLYDEPVSDVQRRKFEDTDKFAEKFATPYGEAVLKFGSDKIKIGKDVLSRELSSIGYSNAQIKVSKVSDTAIYFAVSLGSVAFNAPIKVENDLVQLPSILISNGNVKQFSEETIRELYGKQTDVRAAASASPLYDLSSRDLIVTIKNAVSEKNLAKAEDALGVLSANGDKIAYATGLQIFMTTLGQEKVEENKCSNIVKSAQHGTVCSHTGLPVNKVYQDEQGNCKPLYRKSMDSTYKPFLSIHHKVFG